LIQKFLRRQSLAREQDKGARQGSKTDQMKRERWPVDDDDPITRIQQQLAWIIEANCASHSITDLDPDGYKSYLRCYMTIPARMRQS
jgi:hypothetical protein